jgi:hypothetical protein
MATGDNAITLSYIPDGFDLSDIEEGDTINVDLIDPTLRLFDSSSHSLSASTSEYSQSTTATQPSLVTQATQSSIATISLEDKHRIIQRKRARGREGTETPNKRNKSLGAASEESSGLMALAEAIRAVAKARVTAQEETPESVRQAITLFIREFKKPPRRLNKEQIQMGIELLENPKKATMFLTLSELEDAEGDRDRWIYREARLHLAADIEGEVS